MEDWARVIVCRSRRLLGELEEGKTVLGEIFPKSEVGWGESIFYAHRSPRLPPGVSGKSGNYGYSYRQVMDAEGCLASFTLVGDEPPLGLGDHLRQSALDRIYRPVLKDGQPVAVETDVINSFLTVTQSSRK